jgi:dTMP kinase
MYIIIEGIDTAGKSTQLDILKKTYPKAIFTKEPGGTAIGTHLREMVLNGEAKSYLAEMFLFLADRAEHNFEIVKNNPDKMIISDRGFLSGIAYAKKVPLYLSIELNLIALDNTLPDKVIILELPKETLQQRLNSKSQDSIEQRGIQYLLDIQERMIETAKLLMEKEGKKLNTLIIDASKPIDTIAAEINNFLKDN